MIQVIHSSKSISWAHTMCQNLGYSSELQSPFFTKYSHFRDWILPKVRVGNRSTNRFHVFFWRKLFGFTIFKKASQWDEPSNCSKPRFTHLKNEVSIYSAQNSVSGCLRVHNLMLLFTECSVWLIKEKKWRQFILLFTESPKYEMLIIITRNTVQIKILLDDHAANWREDQRGLINGKIHKCFMRRSIQNVGPF